MSTITNIAAGDTFHVKREPLNGLTGTGPTVSKRIKVTGFKPATVGRGRIVVSRVTHINGKPADEYLAKDKVYKTATPQQLDRIKDHESHESRFTTDTHLKEGATIAASMAKSFPKPRLTMVDHLAQIAKAALAVHEGDDDRRGPP
jgi:hypothetical protein